MRKIPTTVETTYTAGMWIYNDGSQDNLPATTTTQFGLLGIAQESKSSSATTTDIHILVPNSMNSTFYADGGSGTLTKEMEGDGFDFEAGGLTIAQATSTYFTAELVKFKTASSGIFRLRGVYGVEN